VEKKKRGQPAPEGSEDVKKKKKKNEEPAANAKGGQAK